MSKRMQPATRRALFILACLGFGFVALATFDLLFSRSGIFSIVLRLVGGVVPFLAVNIPKMSGDAGTWGPGLMAFGLGLGVMHRLMRAWAAKRAKPWTIGSTICLGALLPILFAISFLVPGVLLQLGGLARDPMISRERPAERTQISSDIKVILIGLYDASDGDPGGRFPGDLSELGDFCRKSLERLGRTTRDPEGPAETPIYLGAGLSNDADPDLPLVISPPYRHRGVLCRFVGKMDCSVVEIPAEELDAWIDKAVAARGGFGR